MAAASNHTDHPAVLPLPFTSLLSSSASSATTNNNTQSQLPAWRRWVVQWDISHNAIPLAFFAFTAMWQAAGVHLSKIGNVSHVIYLILFYTSCIILILTLTIFIVRIRIYPPALASDFHHPRLMNFFFMPVIIGCLLVLTLPSSKRSVRGFSVAFYLLAAYQLILALYMFGEWLFGTHPTHFIHPLVFMQTIGYFLTANIAARAHLLDQASAMLYIGVLFWLLVFITNFQHVALALDKQRERPSPTFFLFIAPPAQAALTFVVLETALKFSESKSPDLTQLLKVGKDSKWPQIGQAFLFIDLFLYALMFRLFPTFWTSKFSVSSWAYIFPLSAASSAIILKYVSSNKLFWEILAMLSGTIACVAMIVVLGLTVKSIANGKTPSNQQCLSDYEKYYVAHRIGGTTTTANTTGSRTTTSVSQTDQTAPTNGQRKSHCESQDTRNRRRGRHGEVEIEDVESGLGGYGFT